MLAERIKQSRKDAKLSQAGLAETLGLDRSAVAQWERNTPSSPTVGHLIAIARVTGVAFEWLATGRGPRRIGGDGEQPPAIVMDYVAQCESEERLLVAFRSLDAMRQAKVLARVEKEASAS
ncbi:helix-turn-helix domain-containing protein [Arenimonas sp. MALMAid1274]|uniref:helix-turn-helix domain-containing protein n=1 Tax=Arenimonas sp. MALMAid1274 TaxID=3411630 RepID=UPI003B9FEA87